MIFVDTGAWYAIIIPTEPEHVSVMNWLSKNTQPLLTTDFVLDETVTLLKARGHNHRALIFGQELFAGRAAALHYVTPEDIQDAWRVFDRFSDKEWSFTDCVSKVVMEKFHLTQALALDHHFRQFGSVQIVP